MKQCLKTILLVLSLSLMFSLVFSCNNGLDAGAKSSMNVEIKASRALADGLDYERYIVTCQGPDAAYIQLDVQGSSVSVTDIVGGEWTVSVEAFELASDTQAAATGSSGTITVPHDGTLDVTVELQPVDPTPTSTNTATPTATASATATTTIAPIEIANPGAESGTTGWTGDGLADTGEARSGSYSFLLKHANTLSQTIAVPANTDLEIKAWGFLRNADTTISLSAAGNSVALTSPAGSWQEMSLSVNSGSATSITISILSEGKWSWVFVDDISISGGTTGPDPSPTVTIGATVSPTNTFTATPTATATNTIAPTATYGSGDNHVENGTFNNLDGWTIEGNVVVSSGAAKLGPVFSKLHYLTSKSVYADEFYQFSADASLDSTAGWSNIGVNCLDSSNTSLYAKSVQIKGTSMTNYSFFFVPPAGTDHFEVYLTKGGSAGYMLLDNVEIRMSLGIDPRPTNPTDGTRVWQETQPGLIVIEAESLQDDPGQWLKATGDGESYQEYTGVTQTLGGEDLAPLSAVTDSNKIMEFKVHIPANGAYKIRLSNRHAQEDGDNDCWFWSDLSTADAALDNWAKFHDDAANQWTWDESGDWIKADGFAGGIYTIKIAGRSKGFKIDRIVIYDSSYDLAVDGPILGSAPESYYSYGSGSPDPSPTVVISPSPTIFVSPSPTTPVDGIAVDGSLGDWSVAIDTAVTKMASGSGTADIVNYAYFANQAGLFVGVEVLDNIVSTTYGDVDSVEVFIDGDNIAQGNSTVDSWALPGYGADEYQFIIVAGQVGVTAKKPGEYTALPSGVTGASQITANGYEAEIFIPWTAMGISASSNFKIGFDLAVNDLDLATARERQLIWYGTADNWHNSSLFGELNLSVSSEVDTESPSQVSNISASFNNPFYGSAAINFTAAYDNIAVSSYTVELSDGQSQSITGTTCSFSGLDGQRNYTVSITATDAAGNTSLTTASFTTPVLEFAPSPSPTAVWDGSRRPVGGNFAALAPQSDVVMERPFKDGINWGTAYANGVNIWRDDFIAALIEVDYPVLRMMNWGATNGCQISQWSERAQVTDNHYEKNTYKANAGDTGMAYEWMIDLCNRVDSDLWICIPHMTIDTYEADPSNNYFTKLAQMVKDKLNPHLNVYVEFSNETWNFTFPWTQSFWLGGRGVTWKFDGQDYTASFYMSAYGLIRVHKAFKEVFGAESDRVKSVLAGQGMSKWDRDKDGVIEANWGAYVHYCALNNITLNPDQGMDCSNINPWDITPDYYSIASYCGATSGAASNLVEQWTASVTEQIDIVERLRRSDITLPVVAYEGGSHITTAADSFARHPQVYDMYWDWAERLAPAYEFMVHFNNTFKPATNKAWGLLEYTGQPYSQAPRFRALRDYNRGYAKQ